MIGAIAGDIIGSIHEGAGLKTKEFRLFDRHARFTDDTARTVAVADCILQDKDLVETLHEYFHRYLEGPKSWPLVSKYCWARIFAAIAEAPSQKSTDGPIVRTFPVREIRRSTSRFARF